MTNSIISIERLAKLMSRSKLPDPNKHNGDTFILAVAVQEPIHVNWHNVCPMSTVAHQEYKFQRVRVVDNGNWSYRWAFCGEVML